MFILKNIDEIGFIHLTDEDVVRHPVVRKIIQAYSSEEGRMQENKILTYFSIVFVIDNLQL